VTSQLGPGPMHRSETASSTAPIAARGGRDFSARSYVRPLVGLGSVVLMGAIIALAIGLFRGDFTDSVPVTVLSPRAGLVMNPGAKVTIHGAQVGSVQSIDPRPDGTAVLHLAIDPSELHVIPANVTVRIASPTVFGGKAVQLVPPVDASTKTMYAGQVLDAEHVTVELNTIFEQLTSVLSKIDPAKLNETLGALATGLSGRGEKLGQTLSDLNTILATLEPALPNLRRDIADAPAVFNAYADAAPDLIRTVDNATRISETIVDQQHNLDRLLVSVIGFAEVGNDVVGTNSKPLADVLRLLVPTTDLTNEYHEAIGCGLGGIVQFAKQPPSPVPGILTTISLLPGRERYRFPGNLPKVAATGASRCADQALPIVPPGFSPPFLVTDVGANPWQYGNQGIVLNADGLKQFLFGPIDGPPRNIAQIGQPG
jgi:phospholipid/cholesterol/gamma-HCH transport system substrate-binding protein